MTDHDAYNQRVVRDDDELNALIDLVVVPETWFFRDAEAFTAATAFVQEKLTRTPRPLRLLSIPCASGEEPASLAMALLDAGVSTRDFTIEAVDVSRQSIERTQRGIYYRNAFRTSDLAFRDRHFTQSSDSYVLSAAVRAQIQSRCGNLLNLDEPVPGNAFDVIFCRNLLIYFDEPTQRAAIRKLQMLLGDGGLLFVGYAEAATFCRHGFAMAPFPKAFALKKALPQDATEPRATARPKLRRPRVPHVPHVPPAAKQLLSPSLGEPAAAKPIVTLLQQARLLADAGRADDACAKYQAYLQCTPDSAEAYFMLGLLSERMNKAGVAETYLRRAIYLDPGHYDALCHLALLAEREGHVSQAAGLRQRAARVFERRTAQGNR